MRGPYSSGCGYSFSRRWLELSFLALTFPGGSFAQTAQQANAQAAAGLAAGKFDTAILQLEAAVRRFPQDAHLQFNLGLALVRKGRLNDAVAPLEKAAQDPSLATEARFLLGADYFESKQYEPAISALRGLESSDHAERVLYMVEESNRRAGHIEEARAAFHQLITRYPDSAWTHYLLGTAYEDQQQLDKAVQEYKEALERDPKIPNAAFAIGYLYWRQQDSVNAREWLRKETLHGCHSLAHFYLGEIARTEREWRTAEAAYRQALVCDSANGEAHLRLGIVLGNQKRFAEALRQLKEAARLQPNESSPHYHLASLYRQLGRNAEAESEYKKVHAIQASKDLGVDVTGESKR